MPEEKTLKIIALEAQNVKKLKAVTIRPDGNLVVIGGDNDAGKSSCLDAIFYALGGKDVIPPKPVREGEKKATIQVDLGDLIVVKTITAEGGGTLTVKSKDGAKYPSPQSMLDKLIGKLSFDPIAFTRMDPKKRLETLRNLAGVDTTELDNKRKALYDERTMVNREVKSAEARVASAVFHKDAPKEEISIIELSKQLQAAQEENGKYTAIKDKAVALKEEIKDTTAQIIGNCEEIDRLKIKIKELEKTNEELTKQNKASEANVERMREEFAKPRQYDSTALSRQIGEAEFINANVRANKEFERLKALEKEKIEKAESLTKQIAACEEEKTKIMAAAKFPLPELGYNDDGVTLGGVPWEQASASQQLRASVAMGIAMNKKLKIMLIRDASLLDEKSLALIAKMADEHDTQCWIERVGQGKEVSVIIEDGMVKEASK